MTAARAHRVLFSRLSILGLFILLIAWRDVDDDSFLASPEPLTRLEAEAIFRKRLPKHYRDHAPRLAEHLIRICERQHFDPAFVLSLVHVESTFNPKARSRVGARGLMQFLPTTAKYIADRKSIPYKNKNDLFDPYVNLELGVNYLAYLRKRFETPDQFLAAYNLGPARVRRNLEKGDYRMSVIRPYVEKIKKGVALMRKEGSELALVASYADTLSNRENGLWQGLVAKTAYAAAPLLRAPASSGAPEPAVYKLKEGEPKEIRK